MPFTALSAEQFVEFAAIQEYRFSGFWETFFTDFGGSVERLIQADALAGQAITDSTTEILELAGSRDPILTAKVLSGLGDYTEDEQEQIDRGIAAYIAEYDMEKP